MDTDDLGEGSQLGYILDVSIEATGLAAESDREHDFFL